MKRYLSIVLDEACIVTKDLKSDEAYKLDSYILNNFNNSEEIREKYKTEITVFLNKHKNMIENIEKRQNKTYRGQIVLLEVQNNGVIKRVKVLYKKDLKKIKNEYIKNQTKMREYITTHKKYFSNYIIDKTKYNLSDSAYEYMINEWYKQIVENITYFEICRSIIKFFENKNKINNEISQKRDNIQANQTHNIISLEEIDKEYDQDRDYHPDLDEIEKLKRIENQDENNFTFYEESNQKQKTKRKHLEIPGQMSFFD